MFIQIDKEIFNTDHIVWAEEGDHRNQGVTILHLTNGKTIELPYVSAETLWGAVGREDIDELFSQNA